MLTQYKKFAFAGMTFAGIWLLTEAIVGQVYRTEISNWESPPLASRDSETKPMQGNPYLLYEYPPGIFSERACETCNWVDIEINELGLRGPNLATPKPPNLRRFITTGDSSVFGFGVADNEIFSAVAAESLGGCEGCEQRRELPSWSPLPAVSGVESVCGATPGYTSFQSINLMRLRGLQAEPDLVVIANLWSDNNFDSFVDKELLAQYGDYKESFTGRMKSTLAYSNIYRVLDWRIRVKKSHEKLRDQIQKVGWMIGTGNPTGRRRVEINDYAANLETLTQMALANDAEVLFLVLANREDFNEGKRPQDLAWFEYRQVMRDTAARHGAMVIDIPTVFGESGYGIEELFIDEMHPTVLGHRLMGEALAAALADADWANGGTVMGAGDGSSIPTYTDSFVSGDSGTGSGEVPIGDGGGNAYVIEGEIKCRSCEGPIRIEAIEPEGFNPQVKGWTVMNSTSGSFQMNFQADMPNAKLRAYDLKGGGANSTTGASPINFQDGGVFPIQPDTPTVLIIDLDKQTLSVQ